MIRRIVYLKLMVLFFGTAGLVAQGTQVPFDDDGKVKVIDTKLSAEIGLFTEYDGFQEARLFQSGKEFILQITYQPDSKPEKKRMNYSKEQVRALRSLITRELRQLEPHPEVKPEREEVSSSIPQTAVPSAAIAVVPTQAQTSESKPKIVPAASEEVKPPTRPQTSAAKSGVQILGAGLASKIRIADSSIIQIITITDGTKLNGRIVKVGDNFVLFEMQSGNTVIELSKIKSIVEIAKKSEGSSAYPLTNARHLLFAPTARMMKPGELYFHGTELAFFGGAIGVTNNLSMGIGGSFLGNYYLAPKMGMSLNENVSLAVGTFYMSAGDVIHEFGLNYAVASFGDANGSISTGIGYTYSGSNAHDNIFSAGPKFMLGGEKRLSRQIGIVAEFIAPNADDNFLSFGLRIFGQRAIINLALIYPMKGGDFVPYVDCVVYSH